MFPEEKDEVVQLYLDDIIPNRFQPREVFDEKALKELAVSIKEHGVIQPIIVRNVNGKYEIIAGERRYKASALAGLTKIPAIIRDLDDKETSKVALLENLQRRNLNPIEEARTYQKILELDQMTQESLAKTMGKSQSAVANKIRLLSLSDEVQNALLKEEISERHARTLLNISDPKAQKDMLKKVIDNKMSVRALEEEIKKINQPEKTTNTEIQNSTNDIASSSAFVNSSPLIPTADLPEDTSNYGKVTIAPPEGDDTSMNKFINYGEIGKEEDKEDIQSNSLEMPQAVTSIDTNEIRNSAANINNNSGGADLDNLLNLGNPTSSTPSNQFITPAEKIVKTDSGDIISDNSSDYFKTPDFISIDDSPSSSILNSQDNNMFLAQTPMQDNNSQFITTITDSSNNKYSIEEATKKIRDLVSDLKDHGIKINTDEMNFEKSYQMIIKIDKTEDN